MPRKKRTHRNLVHSSTKVWILVYLPGGKLAMVRSIVSVWMTSLMTVDRFRPLARRLCPLRVCLHAAQSAHQGMSRIALRVSPSIPWSPPSLNAWIILGTVMCPIRLWNSTAGFSGGLST